MLALVVFCRKLGLLCKAMKEAANILLVDDDRDMLGVCRLLLKKHFHHISTTEDPDRIPSLVKAKNYDAVLLDMNFKPGDNSGQDGLRWLSYILEQSPRTAVIMITAFSSVDAAVEAMKRGAVDFIEKPWNNQKLLSTLKNAVRLRQAEQESRRLRRQTQVLSEDLSRRHHPIIGESEGIHKVLNLVRKAAPTVANVLILGENGTGKELIAREIHAQSNRNEEVFVSVDLGAIPHSLMESELFGYKKGAFTDAKESHPGRFLAADKGTFFLDEIGNLPLTMQPKLLRALETREVTPLGGTNSEPIDIRLISATNLPWNSLTDNQRFRPDLLFRLNTVEIHIPPLRERAEDIPLLANAFLAQYARKYNRHINGLSDNALNRLMEYHWPGNVRELRYSIERAVILADRQQLVSSDFSALHPHDQDNPAPSNQTLDEIERASVEGALKKHEGNISRAAKELGITRTSLYRRINKFGL